MQMESGWRVIYGEAREWARWSEGVRRTTCELTTLRLKGGSLQLNTLILNGRYTSQHNYHPFSGCVYSTLIF